MNYIIRNLIVGVSVLLIWGICFDPVYVYADEGKKIQQEDGILAVDIVRNDGIRVKPDDKEATYTSMQLNYHIDMGISSEVFVYRLNADEKNKGIDEQIDYDITCQYAISEDDGVSYGEWQEISGGAFAFIPGSIKDGIYCIKFRKLEEYVLKADESTVSTNAVPVSSNSVSGNKIEKNRRAEYERDRKTAERIVRTEPVHVTESKPYHIFLDSVSPTIDLYTDKDLEKWTNESIRFKVRVNDTGSGPAWLKVYCEDAMIAEEPYARDSKLSGFEKEITISNESVHDKGSELIIEAADTAGNVNVIKQMIKIDKTSPGIEIEGVENSGIYDRTVKVMIKGEDVHPSTVCVGYTVKRIYDGNEEIIESSAGTLEELKENALFLAQQDGDYCVECRAVDAAGNSSALVKSSFRVDKTAPGIGFEGVTDGGIFKNDAVLKINAYDNFDSSYKVRLSGSVTTQTGTNDLRLAEYKTDGRYSQNTYFFKSDGDYEIRAEVTDSAGNTCEDSIRFKIDATPPVIDMTGGINSNSEMITNEPPTLSFRVKENNYETSNVSCILKRKTGEDKTKLCKTPGWVMDAEVSDFSLTIEEEGTYELNLQVTDAAGNTAGKTLKFTLDMTKPEIDYIENLNKKYVKSFRLPDNFSEYIHDKGKVDYRTYINSMNYDESQEISEDGKYILKVSAVDDAGNQAEKTVEFIVDSTLPRVVIDGMTDDGSVNKDDVLRLSLYDDGDYFRSVKLNGVELVTQTGQQDIEVTIPDYGDYTIKIEASDMADNILTQTIEAKCANAAPVAKGVSTMRTLKKNEQSGSNKGLRIFLIVLTVLILAGSVIVYYLYTVKTADKSNMYQ